MVFMGNVKNSSGLEAAVAFQVVDKLHAWTNTSNGKLDLTTLIPTAEEPTTQPGILIHTPQANQPSPARGNASHPLTQ
jgi:hypothetical protein